MSEIEFNSLDDLLHNKVIAIPDYQRDYSWGKAEISTLLEDIESLVRINKADGETEHFCGAIVAVPFDGDVSKNTKGFIQSKSLKNFNRINVIDGQQRLSTLSLFLLALYNYAENNNLSGIEIFPLIDTGKKVDNKHVPKINFADLDTQNCYYKLLYPHDSVELHYDNTRQGPKRLEAAYKMCLEAIEEICNEFGTSQETIEIVFEQVQYRLSFVDIYCKREVDAYQIFESLNSTGLSLTPAEQVKNLILMKSANTNMLMVAQI